MLCGGADEYDAVTVAVFDNLLACSTAFNGEPHRTPRPFDKSRDGLVVAEGAGAVMLEEYEFARKRGADILAEIVGFACNNNGGDLILPNLEGITNTLKLGLENARLDPAAVDLISAHATATKMGDIIEAQAINNVFGSNPYVVGLKSYLGHTMAACGAIETILTLYMMQDGFVAPTLNLEDVDERCAMIRHVQKIIERPVATAAIQNFAFGGVNTILLVKKFS
ncbi:MAG TPA: beta-ketoacyl synthase N-terminal-like domain-containing protein, partial [Smithellaceae bacterium]|nr:beta-ketoacyl synthase N-terminal-like domain-containing protein [Smithellaceae bacterium]